jgi:hypothetical protein
LKLKKCNVRGIGVKLFELSNKAGLRVTQSNLSLEEVSKNICLIEFMEGGSESSLKRTFLKLRTSNENTNILYSGHEQSTVSVAFCQISVKSGIYLSFSTRFTSINFAENKVCLPDSVFSVKHEEDLKLAEYVLEDPAYAEKIIRFVKSVKIENAFYIVANKKLTIEGLPEIASPYDTNSICISDTGSNYFYDNQKNISELKKIEQTFDCSIEFKTSTLLICNLTLAGSKRYENCNITIRDTQIFNDAQFFNCTVVMDCVKAFTDSILSFENCKIEFNNYCSVLSKLIITNSKVRFENCKLDFGTLSIHDCDLVHIRNSTIECTKSDFMRNSLQIYNSTLNKETEIKNCFVIGTDLPDAALDDTNLVKQCLSL